MGTHDRTAICWLGKNLHVLQDFTDDPAKLLAAITHLDSGRDLMPANVEDAMADLPTGANGDADVPSLLAAVDPKGAAMTKGAIENTAALSAQVYGAMNDVTTTEALMRIVSHLSGMPGRRNLIWLKESPAVPPRIMFMLQQAGIHLYPVLVRTVLVKGPDIMALQHAARKLGTATGGAGFDDARDIELALKTAEEDSASAYTLGYYPSEASLDGKFHSVVVKAGSQSGQYELRYRPGYLATKQPFLITPVSAEAAITESIRNPLDATGLGIRAECDPDKEPGRYMVRMTVDLHDVHLNHEATHSTGAIQVAFVTGEKAAVKTFDIDIADADLSSMLETGYRISASGITAVGRVTRIVVRDSATGISGSLTIPLTATPEAHSR